MHTESDELVCTTSLTSDPTSVRTSYNGCRRSSQSTAAFELTMPVSSAVTCPSLKVSRQIRWREMTETNLATAHKSIVSRCAIPHTEFRTVL